MDDAAAPVEEQEQEYQSVETAELVSEALAKRAALPMGWLETRLYGDLYESLSKYMDRTDLLVMLSDQRNRFLEGFTRTTPENLHNVCKRCRLCEGVKHPAIDPGWNLVDPDLMIVVENPTVSSYAMPFLTASLKQAGFKSDRVMLTYMTRCPVDTQDLTSTHIANCTPYLHSEMQACNPKLVLVLGAKTWGAVTGDVTHKISEVESEIIWFGLFPLLPGMSLAWYLRTAENSDDKDNNRFVRLLNAAHNFLYPKKS